MAQHPKNLSGALAHIRDCAASSAGEIACGLAFGCLGAWISMVFKSLNIFTGLPESEHSLDMVYLISIITVVATLLYAASKQVFLESYFAKTYCPFIFALGMSAATLLMSLGDVGSTLGFAASVCAGIISGFFSGLLLVYIGYIFSFMSMRSLVISAVASSLTSALFFALFLPLNVLPALIVSCLMPFISAVLLWFGKKKAGITFEEALKNNGDDTDDTLPLEPYEVKMLTVKLSLTAFFAGLANEIARTLYVQMELVSAGGTAYATMQAWTTFACAVILIIIALSLLNLKRIRKAACYSYHLLLVSLLFGVALLPLPLIIPQAGSFIPHAINAGALTCFGMLFWVVTAAFSGHSNGHRIQTFALIRAGWAAGPLFGLLLGRFILSQGLQVHNAYIASLLGILVIMLIEAVIFSEADLMKAMDIMPLERKRRFQEKCEQLIAAYGLTEREGEIMTLFAKGRNLPYIQEMLFLSKSTVSTHRQHIYAKLDIHSQQELIDRVQSFEAQDRK